MSDHKALKVNNCKLIKLNKIKDSRGNITFLESNKNIPFEISRVYYLYDTPSGAERGGHAHYDLKQLILAVSGSFDVVIDDGKNREIIKLLRPDEGLFISSMVWRELKNFSGGAVCLVLASNFYDESDYIRDYHEFIKILNHP